jgi:hypothetical protein
MYIRVEIEFWWRNEDGKKNEHNFFLFVSSLTSQSKNWTYRVTADKKKEEDDDDAK